MKEARRRGYLGAFDGSRREVNLRIVDEMEEGCDGDSCQSRTVRASSKRGRYTDVTSRFNGWMSGFDSAWTKRSSQRLLTGM